MVSIAARMSGKGQVVIPKQVRQVLGLRGNDQVLFVIDGDTVLLRPRPPSFAQALLGLHREVWPEPDAWLEGERASWEGR